MKTEKILKTVSMLLRNARRAEAITQNRLAKLSGVTQPAIARIEGNGTVMPRLELLHKLFKAMGYRFIIGTEKIKK